MNWLLFPLVALLTLVPGFVYFWAIAGDRLGWFSFNAGLTILMLFFVSGVAIFTALQSYKLFKGNYAALKIYKDASESQLPMIAKHLALLKIATSIGLICLIYTFFHWKITFVLWCQMIILFFSVIIQGGEHMIERKHGIKPDRYL